MKRYKVKVQCKKCGEIYTLRGRKDKLGKIDTGFKQCICDNTHDFNVSTEFL